MPLAFIIGVAQGEFGIGKHASCPIFLRRRGAALGKAAHGSDKITARGFRNRLQLVKDSVDFADLGSHRDSVTNCFLE